MLSATFDSIATGKKAASCAKIDCVIVVPDGAKLKDAVEEVGTGSEQLVAQQSLAEFARGVCSLLLALSQHFII